MLGVPIPERAGGIDRGLAWALAGFAIYVISFLVSLALLATAEATIFAPLGVHVAAGTESLSIRNGAWHLLWGLVAAGAAVPVGRRLFPSLAFGAGGWAMLAIGLTLAGITEYHLDEYVRRWAGYYDPEYAGMAIFAAPALDAVALAAWAGMAVPRSNRAALIVLTVLASAGLVVALAPSLERASDGIRGENIGIATVFVLDALFAACAVVVALVGRGREA